MPLLSSQFLHLSLLYIESFFRRIFLQKKRTCNNRFSLLLDYFGNSFRCRTDPRVLLIPMPSMICNFWRRRRICTAGIIQNFTITWLYVKETNCLFPLLRFSQFCWGVLILQKTQCFIGICEDYKKF